MVACGGAVTPKAEAYERHGNGRPQAPPTNSDRLAGMRQALYMARQDVLQAQAALVLSAAVAATLAREWAERALPVPEGLEARVAGEAIAGLIDVREACAVLRPELAAEVEHWASMPAEEWISARDQDSGPWEVRTLVRRALAYCPKDAAGVAVGPSDALPSLEEVRRRQEALRHARAAIHAVLEGRDEAAVDELRAAAKALGTEARGDVWREVAGAVERRDEGRRCSICAAVLRPVCERPNWRICRVAGRQRARRSPP